MMSALAKWKTEATGWFYQRSIRERWMIGGLGAIALFYILVTFVWSPLSEARSQALADIALYENTIARLDAYGTTTADSSPRQKLPATQAITQSAAEAGLAIRRLEPDGNQTTVMLDRESFDTMINWIATLEQQHRLSLISAEINRQTEPGSVNARLTFSR